MSQPAPEPPKHRPNLFARIRLRVDASFGSWAEKVGAHPWRVIAVSILAFAVIVPQARFLEVSTDTEEFLFPDHPIRIAYDAFRAQFGSDNYVLITLEHDEIFSQDFLTWLEEVHDALDERVPHVNEITSLVNVRSTRGEGDELIVDDLLEEWPEDEEALARVEAIVRATPFHRRLVLGDDGRHTTIQLELERFVTESEAGLDLEGFDTSESATDDATDGSTDTSGELERLGGAQEEQVMTAVWSVLEKFERDDVGVYLAGTPYVNVRIFQDMGRNTIVFILLSIVIVAVVLGFVFRRASGVVLPLVVVFVCLAMTLGLVPLRGEPVNMTAQIVPSFLLAVGCSSSIHLLVLFYQAFDAGSSRLAALRAALSHAGMPIVLTCTTTAAGLASFLVADVAPVRDLGFMAPLGIGLGLVLVLSLLPALLMVVPLRRRPPVVAGELSRATRAMIALGDLGYRRPLPVLFGTAVLVLLSLGGIARITFEQNALEWFPPSDPIHANTVLTDEQMGGSSGMEIVIDTGRENGLHEPDFQHRLDAFETALTETGPDRERIRKTISVNGVLKEIHQALNANDPAYYATPDDRALIAQELLLFENSGSDDLEKMVDSQFRLARVNVRTVWSTGQENRELLGRVETTAREAFPDAEVVATGVIPIIMTSMVENQVSMQKSYALAILTITPLMMLLIGSVRGGLSSMVPNLTPIALVIGLMGWLGIPFDVFTLMTGSVAIGLAVDDTIHFLHSFYREFERTRDTRSAIAHTLETTGQALLTTSVVLSVGFSVFLFATMPSLRTFGLVTTLAIVLALLADILVAPALVTLATRHRQASGQARDQSRPD